MEILLDTANLEKIRKYMELYEITGITTNPIFVQAAAEYFIEKKTAKILTSFGSLRLSNKIGALVYPPLKKSLIYFLLKKYHFHYYTTFSNICQLFYIFISRKN